MSWLRKLWAEVVTIVFMMVGISPPQSAQQEIDLKTKKRDKTED